MVFYPCHTWCLQCHHNQPHKQFEIDGETLFSCEGTTQGDPLAKGMYALGVLPLIHELNPFAQQVWYADDATAGGTLIQLHEWWDKVVSLGPYYGYFANPMKTWLTVKQEHHNAAEELFRGTKVNITTDGRKHLGAAVGSQSLVCTYVNEKVIQWVQEIEDLAMSHPQAADAALTHGLMGRWSYTLRTIPDISDLLQPLKDEIRKRLLPALTGKPAFTDIERALLVLPTRLGGLNIPFITEKASTELSASCKITSAIVDSIVQKAYAYDHNVLEAVLQTKAAVNKQRETFIQLACCLTN